MFNLKSPFKPFGDQPAAIDSLVENYKRCNEQVLLGVTGSGKTFTMANVIQRLGKKTLILAHNKTLAAQLYSEFKEFFPDNAVEYFVSYYDYYQPEAYVPGKDLYIEKDASINEEIDKLRHSATRSLLERDDVILISSVSCIYGIGSPKEYAAHRLSLFTGEEYEREQFFSKLNIMQYQRNDFDFTRGSFRVRGEVIEVFPAYEDSSVVRLEFFGNELETIQMVNPISGKVEKEVSKAVVFPASHYVVSGERLEEAIKRIRIELRDQLQYLEKKKAVLERERLEKRTMLDLEMLEELGHCTGIENYSRHLVGSSKGEPPPTLIDYFGDDFLLIVDESHITIPQVGGMYRGDRVRKENLVNNGFRLPSALDNRPLNFDEFLKKIDQALYVSATPGDWEMQKTQGEVVEQLIRPTGLVDPIIEIRPAKDQVKDLLLQIKEVVACEQRVLVTTLTKRLAEDLTSYFKQQGIKVEYLHSDIETIERVELIANLRDGEFDVLVGINLLREGLDIPEVSLVAILDADKEGFLRSKRSLIQTIGRAARNVSGRVILYADKMTQSMQIAIDETLRRREIQIKHNLKEGIEPKTIVKKVSRGIIEKLKRSGGKKRRKKSLQNSSHTGGEVQVIIDDLTLKMVKASESLDFEKAIEIREEIKELKTFL